MRVGSLFAGIGGFDLAAERVGHEMVFHSEIDRHASEVLAHHWPDIPNYGDIHDITPGLDSLPAVDVLVGGFPCQDYSVAGNRSGLAGDRGALWWEYHRLIAGIRPTWVIGENVLGLLSSRGGRDFETIVGSLTELGYGVAWAVLDAQYFGVPQRRRRVFIVGHSGGEPRPEILALGEGVFGHPEKSRETGENIAPTLAARTRGGLGTDTELDGGLVANTLETRPTDERQRPDHLVFNWQTGQDQLSARSTHTDALHAGQTPAVTVPTVRRLTPLECERLQGFPDNWTAMCSDTQRYRQLGNAVAVPVAEWIFRRLGETDE